MDGTLEAATVRWNLLHHSFYQRWTYGTLTHDELLDYVRQYAHVVRAVPGWLEQVRLGDTAEVARHAAEERLHIEMWDKFGGALGLDSEAIRLAPANAATARLVQLGDHLAAIGQAAAAVWALEVQTPTVASAKLAGLSAFYGIGPETGGQYFAEHQQMDVEHAAQLKALCSDGFESSAVLMSEALWDLLTSVETPQQPA